MGVFVKHSALKRSNFSECPTQTKWHYSLLLAQFPCLSFLYIVSAVIYNRMHRLLISFLLPLIVYNMVQASPGPPPNEFRPLRMPPDRMFCRGPLPEFKYGETWTSWSVRDSLGLIACDYLEWSKLNFTDLTDLCTAHGNIEGNMGGMVAAYSWILIHVSFD